MCDFLTLKMLPLACAMIKTKNRCPFDPFVRKCTFYMRNQRLEFLMDSEKKEKKGNF